MTWIMPCSNDRPMAENRKFHIERFKPISDILHQEGCVFGLDALDPNLNEKVATKLAEIMERPLREGPHSPGVSISEFLATARFLQDVYGWKAPAKSIRANVKVDATKRLLPSD